VHFRKIKNRLEHYRISIPLHRLTISHSVLLRETGGLTGSRPLAAGLSARISFSSCGSPTGFPSASLDAECVCGLSVARSVGGHMQG